MKGIRSQVEIVLAVPMPSLFTKPQTSAVFSKLLKQKNIEVIHDYHTGSVDTGKNTLISWDNRHLEYDLLVTIPTNMGADFIQRSKVGDELNFVTTNPYTLQSKNWQNIWVIGDASDLPASKAGSVVHFQFEPLIQNILSHLEGREPTSLFNGHVNCVVEAGYNKGVFLDFDYESETPPGKIPIPIIGPFSSLQESTFNYWAKQSIQWLYWNTLLRYGKLPNMTKVK
jgi:sulfide:quinone oxidoreductase